MRDYLLENVIVPPQKGIHHSVPDNVVSERKEMGSIQIYINHDIPPGEQSPIRRGNFLFLFIPKLAGFNKKKLKQVGVHSPQPLLRPLSD